MMQTCNKCGVGAHSTTCWKCRRDGLRLAANPKRYKDRTKDDTNFPVPGQEERIAAYCELVAARKPTGDGYLRRRHGEME